MGRKIFVTSDMSVDEHVIEVAEKDPQAALLWPWILTAFDDWGRSNADARRLKASVFPSIETVTPEAIESALRLYAEARLIILYEHGGKPYMAIPPEKWFKYQTHIRREKRTQDRSHCPAPPQQDEAGSAQVREDARNSAQEREDARTCTPSPSPSPSPTCTPTSSSVLSGESVPRDDVDDDDDGPSNAKSIVKVVFETLGHLPTAWEIQTLRGYDLPFDVLVRALQIASANGARRITYVQRVLDSWVERGVRTVEDVDRIEAERKAQGTFSSRASPRDGPAEVSGRVIASAAETDAFLEQTGALKLLQSDSEETDSEDRVAT